MLLLGSSGGIGFSVAQKLLKSGYTVYCQYNSEKENLNLLKKKYKNKIFILNLDINSKKKFKKIFEQNRKN